jgi:hypothetical protein
MKAAREGSHFKEPEDLLEEIIEFLKEIHPSELMILFHHWIERVQWVIEHNGDSYHE